MWSCACAPAPAAYRGGAEHFPPFGRKLQNPDWPAPPQSGYSPRSGSPRPCEQSVPQLPSRPGVGPGFDASSHRTCARRAFGTIPEWYPAGRQSLGRRVPCGPVDDQSRRVRSLGVRELRPTLQLASQDLVLSGEIFIPQQQLLVYRPADVGEDACPLHELPHSRPFAMATLIAPNNVTDNARRARAEWHKLPNLSCSANFLAIRQPAASAALEHLV